MAIEQRAAAFRRQFEQNGVPSIGIIADAFACLENFVTTVEDAAQYSRPQSLSTVRTPFHKARGILGMIEKP